MNIFETQIKELYQLLNYENYTQLIKRIIDFTLDTENVIQYKETLQLLEWIENNSSKSHLKERLTSSIENLCNQLSTKTLSSEEQTLLSVDGLIRSYKNSAFSFGPISFTIKERQIIGLVGENGNGKTTLLRLLCGELQTMGGSITYGFPYKDNYDLRSHLIYIPQRTASWQGSLLSNLKFTASTYGIIGEANELICQLVIARMGLRKFRNHKWRDLSSGYKMRFELARALLRKPKLLLIDEPLANLDILAQQTVLDDFRDIVRSPFRPAAIVLSSQQLYEVEKTSDDVIFLKNGSPRNLIKDTDAVFVEVPKFIIEFESEWDQEQIYGALSLLGIERLQKNGGTYVARFPNNITIEAFLQLILDKHIPITYLRNISNSTRRFFLS